MILLDANLLIYAYDRSSPFHSGARTWLEQQIQSQPVIGLPWIGVLAFLRITTHSKLVSPQSFDSAARIVDDWLALDNVRVVHPGDEHWSILKGISEEGQARGPLVMDAHLAALAIEQGATLCTNDLGFRRFPRVKLLNPFA